jgi:hypothetical protein
VVVPDWDSDLVRAVRSEFPDESDPGVWVALYLAAAVAGAKDTRDFSPLYRAFRKSMKYLGMRV